MKYVCVCGYVYDPAVGDPENGVAPGTPWEEVPAGCETRVIPGGLWAQFRCTLKTLQSVNTQIWSEWLPSLKEYSPAGDYSIEVYLQPDETGEMACYIWVPLKKNG